MCLETESNTDKVVKSSDRCKAHKSTHCRTKSNIKQTIRQLSGEEFLVFICFKDIQSAVCIFQCFFFFFASTNLHGALFHCSKETKKTNKQTKQRDDEEDVTMTTMMKMLHSLQMSHDLVEATQVSSAASPQQKPSALGGTICFKKKLN